MLSSNDVSRRVRFIMIGCLALLAGGCSGSSETPSTPSSAASATSVTGMVVSQTTGAGVANASISTGSVSVRSDDQGDFTATVTPSNRIVVHVEAPGYAETFRVIDAVAGKTTPLYVALLPVAAQATVATAGSPPVTLSSGLAQVTLPAGGLVRRDGGAVAPEVTVQMTPVNPAVFTRLMPGDFTVLAAGGGAPTAIESFGALAVDLRDAAGNRYTLPSGQSATIRIPVGTRSSERPVTIPLYYLDETTGRWVEEGTATLAGIAPNRYYEGTVTHFSIWNADRGLPTVYVNGCVEELVNGTPQRVAGAQVLTEGITYSGMASDRTAADGTFRVAFKSGATDQAVLMVVDGARTARTQIGPSVVDITLPACLILNAPIDGHYTGRFGGTDTGSFSADVTRSGESFSVSAIGVFDEFNETFSAAGTISGTGTVQLTQGSVSTGATFTGQVLQLGPVVRMNGTWINRALVLDDGTFPRGTFHAVKQSN